MSVLFVCLNVSLNYLLFITFNYNLTCRNIYKRRPTCIGVLPNRLTLFTFTPLESRNWTRTVFPVAAALASSSASCIISITVKHWLKDFTLTGKAIYGNNQNSSHCIKMFTVTRPEMFLCIGWKSWISCYRGRCVWYLLDVGRNLFGLASDINVTTTSRCSSRLVCSAHVHSHTDPGRLNVDNRKRHCL